MTFDEFRVHGQPTYYSAVHLPWEADLLVCGLIYCFSIILLSFCLLVPGISGREKYLFILRVSISLFIGASILVTNFAMTWEIAETTTSTKYKAGTGQEVNATIGVNIGLRGVNITLKADDHEIKGETIDYNEKFSWVGLQGRQGFGPFAGRFNQEYRAAQFRGLPLPILWVAEYFTLDGEGIRWGRFYRQAGYYSHIMLWLAFPLWILTNILFFVLLRYGAYFMVLTGVSMCTANVIWGFYRNDLDLRIPFTEHDALDFSYGPAFWMCLVTGLICILLGTLVFVMDKCWPRTIAIFFGVDILQDSEKIQVEDNSENTVVNDRETYSNIAFDNGEPDSVPVSPADDDEDGIYEESSSVPLPQDQTDQSLKLPKRVSSKKKALKPLQITVDPFVKRSFKTPEGRLTKRWQRPRRKELPSEYASIGTPSTAISISNINMEMARQAGSGAVATPSDWNTDNSHTYTQTHL